MEESKDLLFAAEMIRAGEAAGQLAASLRFSADLLKRQSEFRRRVYGAMAYPAFLMIGSICAVIALAVFAGPAIGPLVAETPEPSAALLAVLATGEWLRRYGLILAAVLAGFGVIVSIAARKPPVSDWLAAARARAPFLRMIVRDINCGAFARILGAMLAGGVSAAPAFRLAAGAAPNAAWREHFLRASEALQEGRSIPAALAVLPSPSPELVRLSRIGEESGTVGEMLNRAGGLAADRALRRLDRFAAMLGPALILVLGAGIGWLMSVFLGGLSQLGEGLV
jgi:type II secretory pathway component PulF